MRLVVLSGRHLGEELGFRHLSPPLEDAISSLPGATLVSPPRVRRATLRASTPAWLAAIKTVRRADVVYWNQGAHYPSIQLWALAYTRPRAQRVCLAMDVSEVVLNRLRHLIRVQRMALCFILYREAVNAIKRESPDAPVEWLPPGFSRTVFQDRGLARDIDVLWVGRRHPPLHAALLRLSDETAYTYRYSHHRREPATSDELSELVARARYYVVTPPGRERTGSFNPLSVRYLEGLGGGARLLGVLPRSGEFEDLLPMDAIVQCAADGSDLRRVLVEADADPRWEEKRLAARDLVHRLHAWENRANHIYERVLSLSREVGTSPSA